MTMRWFACWAMALALVGPSGAQTLARKNWAGSGMQPQAWWERGVFCRVAGGATVKQAQAQMARMQAMGCDAVVMGAPPAEAMADADALIVDVAQRKMRLVLDLPLAGAAEAEVTAKMRFWLNRGVAGMVLVGAPSDPGMVKRLRTVAAGVVGTRVLIGDGPVPDVPLLVRRLGGGVAAVRGELSGMPGGTLVGGSAGSPKASAAVLLLNGAAAELPVEVGHAGLKAKRAFTPDELLLWVPIGDASLVQAEDKTFGALTEWDASLVELHHGNEALRAGTVTYLNHDAEGVLAWVVKGRAGGPPLVIVANLSGKPVKVALRAEVKALGVKGGYLRTLLRSEPGAFATLDAVEVGVDGVVVGEVR